MIKLNDYAVVDYTIEKYFNYCSNFTFILQKNRHEIHPPGFHDCFLRRKNKTILMHIDKCASSSIRYALITNGFCDMSLRIKNVDKTKEYFIKNNYNFYAIIREPKKRYISGLQEFIKIHNPSIEYIISNLKNNKFIFDEHTSPQHCFLFLCEKGCNYLKLDEKLASKVSNIFGKTLDISRKNISHENIKNDCEKIFEKYCKKNSEFYKLYENDFELYSIAA